MIRLKLSIIVLIILLSLSFAALAVEIDVKPGSIDNPVNPRSNGIITVAILGSDVFDVSEIDASTVKFEGASPIHEGGHIEDVNGDGKDDWVGHFKTKETGIECGDIEAELTGNMLDGTPFTGTDSIVTVGCNGKALGHVEGDAEEEEAKGNNGKALGHTKNKEDDDEDEDQDEDEDADTDGNNGKAIGHEKNGSPKGPKQAPGLQFIGKKAFTWGSFKTKH